MKKNNVLSIALPLAIGGISACYGSESESKETVNIATGSEIESVMDDAPEAQAKTYTPWANVKEVRDSFNKWEKNEFDLNDMERQINATADAAINTVGIEDAIYKLWEVEGCINIEIGAIRGLIDYVKDATNEDKKNKLNELVGKGLYGQSFIDFLIEKEFSFDKAKENLSGLLTIAKDKCTNLAKKIIDNTDEHEINDFIKFVVYKISLDTGRYDFKSVAGEMIDLYECTQSDEVRNLIGAELKKFGNAGNKYFGPEGDKMKEFSASLRNILAR